MRFLDKVNFNMNTKAINDFAKNHGNLANNLNNVIHVAGTNGKGSTVSFLRSILEGHGFSVNTFTSPHLISSRERIRIRGKLISKYYNAKLKYFIDNDPFGKKLSVFEKFFAKALLVFNKFPADFTILETGLGGRLDATNIVDHPIASVITPVDLDHEHILGSTKAIIAKEKASIIKEDSILVSAYQAPEVIDVLQKKSCKQNSKSIIGGIDWKLIHTSSSNYNYKLQYGDFNFKFTKLGLAGEHQLFNASLAIVTLKTILQNKLSIACTRKGLKDVYWPGRMQTVQVNYFNKPITAIVDGAHNPHGAKALVSYINRIAKNKNVCIIMALLRTKSLESYLQEFINMQNACIYAVNLSKSYNAYSSKEIVQHATKLGINAVNAGSVDKAFKQCNKDIIVVCGSLYLVGKVLKDNKILSQ